MANRVMAAAGAWPTSPTMVRSAAARARPVVPCSHPRPRTLPQSLDEHALYQRRYGPYVVSAQVSTARFGSAAPTWNDSVGVVYCRRCAVRNGVRPARERTVVARLSRYRPGLMVGSFTTGAPGAAGTAPGLTPTAGRDARPGRTHPDDSAPPVALVVQMVTGSTRSTSWGGCSVQWRRWSPGSGPSMATRVRRLAWRGTCSVSVAVLGRASPDLDGLPRCRSNSSGRRRRPGGTERRSAGVPGPIWLTA